MSDTKPPSLEGAAALPEVKPDVKSARPLKPPNPMWKYMGFGENFRPKLPSRNWTIFLTITGSFTAAVIYDKREKKRAQRKWCKLVEHVAKEPLDSHSMPRKLTVFLEAPPTDGLRISQDHFKEYVKPILVASGLDWEFIQGRKEGDVRAELAERIRNQRLPPELRIEEDSVGDVRRKNDIQEFKGPRGDIVIGRHTWKEYIRGVHEGWLGPLTEPAKPVPEASSTEEKELEATVETLAGITITGNLRDADTPPTDTAETPAKPETDNKSKNPPQPSPFITTAEYVSAPTPAGLPAELDPSQPISFPHILGFLNTPIRLYRFLNRRVLADSIGRETAAIILSTYRPYHTTSSISEETSTSFSPDTQSDSQSPTSTSDSSSPQVPQTHEIQTALLAEEKEWHKKARVRTEGEGERTWLEPVILDQRIASRMRRFELTAEDEEKARRIVVPEIEVEGWIKGGLRGLGKQGLEMIGLGKKEVKNQVEGDEVLE